MSKICKMKNSFMALTLNGGNNDYKYTPVHAAV